jgi:hypothetical protein
VATSTTERRWLLPADQQAAQDAAELLTYADAYEDAGHTELARRSRVVARELQRVLQELDAERSARRAMQEQRDQARQVIHDQGVRLLQARSVA